MACKPRFRVPPWHWPTTETCSNLCLGLLDPGNSSHTDLGICLQSTGLWLGMLLVGPTEQLTFYARLLLKMKWDEVAQLLAASAARREPGWFHRRLILPIDGRTAPYGSSSTQLSKTWEKAGKSNDRRR
mmetsp:Transcript_48860/g.100867  ORF Transcript_48860/g.100867 Transcript_48860/m.100867 type:complete len:129 (+) Transcript_48860:224-610(+)